MAKAPAEARTTPDLDLVNRVEYWIDSRIPDQANQFNLLKQTVESQFPELVVADWDEIVQRYKMAGWKSATYSHWTSQENGSGPYFHLSMS